MDFKLFSPLGLSAVYLIHYARSESVASFSSFSGGQWYFKYSSKQFTIISGPTYMLEICSVHSHL